MGLNVLNAQILNDSQIEMVTALKQLQIFIPSIEMKENYVIY